MILGCATRQLYTYVFSELLGRLEELASEVKKSETACCKCAGRENRF